MKYIIISILALAPLATFAAYQVPNEIAHKDYGAYTKTQYVVCERHNNTRPTFDGARLLDYGYTLKNCRSFGTWKEYYTASGLEIGRQLVERGQSASRWPSPIGEWITRYLAGER